MGEQQNSLDPGPGPAAIGLRGAVKVVHAEDTRAEDRATLGSDPSAGSAAGMAGEAVLPPPFVNTAANGCAVGAGCSAFPRDSGHSGGKAINPGAGGRSPRNQRASRLTRAQRLAGPPLTNASGTAPIVSAWPLASAGRIRYR